MGGGEQGWFSGGSIPPWCYTYIYVWAEFVGSLCFVGFALGSPVFLPLQKPISPNSNLTRIEDSHENQLRLM